jgi:hypothetical protein
MTLASLRKSDKTGVRVIGWRKGTSPLRYPITPSRMPEMGTVPTLDLDINLERLVGDESRYRNFCQHPIRLTRAYRPGREKWPGSPP